MFDDRVRRKDREVVGEKTVKTEFESNEPLHFLCNVTTRMKTFIASVYLVQNG